MDYLECYHVIEEKDFWDRVARYLKVVTPLVKVLRMVDGDDKNDMGYLYEAMDCAKMKLRQSLPRDYKKSWRIIHHRWESTLHHDLHAADGDEPRDLEFKVPAKRPRESSSKGKQPEIVEDTEEQFEPARYSESDSRSVTPRMVKPPPSLRRTVSGIYMTERANVVARDDQAIEKMKQIY
ncbi:hypothetical protein Taro_006548, partial [Colocasia esculenta]|nr:hypothetical protein [Colocasia esculenta]